MPHRLLLAVCIGYLVGCGKDMTVPSAPASPEATSAESKNLSSADPAAASPQRIGDEQQIAATLNELTQAVRKFGLEQQRVPKSLSDLLTAGYLTRIPDPPAGRKFVIGKKMEVYLTKQ